MSGVLPTFKQFVTAGLLFGLIGCASQDRKSQSAATAPRDADLSSSPSGITNDLTPVISPTLDDAYPEFKDFKGTVNTYQLTAKPLSVSAFSYYHLRGNLPKPDLDAWEKTLKPLDNLSDPAKTVAVYRTNDQIAFISFKSSDLTFSIYRVLPNSIEMVEPISRPPHMLDWTQIGVCKWAWIYDEKGGKTSEEYYRWKYPGWEKSSTLRYRYDEFGREIWMGVDSPELSRRGSLETVYNAAGQKQTRQWRNADGIVRSQTRFTGTELSFDETGERLVSIRGKKPSDIDLYAGWGNAVDGLACGIGVNRNKGKLQDFRVVVTVRNLTASIRNVITCLPYQEIKFELRDASGRLVPQDAEYIRQRDKKLRESNNGTNENVQTISPNECQVFEGDFELTDWYRKVPAGKYTLTLRRRAGGSEFTLVSKPVQVEIVADEP